MKMDGLDDIFTDKEKFCKYVVDTHNFVSNLDANFSPEIFATTDSKKHTENKELLKNLLQLYDFSVFLYNLHSYDTSYFEIDINKNIFLDSNNEADAQIVALRNETFYLLHKIIMSATNYYEFDLNDKDDKEMYEIICRHAAPSDEIYDENDDGVEVIKTKK